MQEITLPLAVFMVLSSIIWLVGRVLLRRVDDEPIEEGRSRQAFGPLTGLLAALLPTSSVAKQILQRELHQAGRYAPHALKDYLSIRNVTLFAWLLLVGFTVFAVYDPQQDLTLMIVVVGILFGMLIFAMPRIMLQSQARRRVGRIQAGLPDGLDMLNMCMTGGLSLQTAFERVGGEIRSSHRDLATEFDIIRRHAETHTMERALDLFAGRIDTPEIRALAAVTSQAVRLGSNVGSAMQQYADGMRTNQRQRAEERGNRRSVAMLFPVALCLAPPVYILLLGPAVLELRDFALRENRAGGALSPNISMLEQGLMSRRLGPATPPSAPRADGSSPGQPGAP